MNSMTIDGSGSHDLAEACTEWQGGRDGGSSPLRAAARVLTGTRHYFSADYIDEYERRAAIDERLLGSARVLLDALADAPARTAGQWAAVTGAVDVPELGFAGRGLVAKPGEDEQIAAAVESGHLQMPLWGVSLDIDQARKYGGDKPRWIFGLVGPFPAVPAWVFSGIKQPERELICGGVFRVVGERTEGVTRWVDLEFESR